MEISNKKVRQYINRLLLARMRILCNHGFYGLLLMHMIYSIDEGCETAYTDGVRIAFSPFFLEELSDKELDYVLMHEILHVVLQHCLRGEYKDNERYNIAADIVINSIIMHENNDNDRFARNNRNNIERICETAKIFCQSVLTVFWTNLDSVKTRDSFLANLTSVPIVEITEDMANAERAEIYLSERAKDNKIDADDKLFNNIKDGKSFHITELNRWFDEWYTEKLHTVVYAQYKDVKTVKAEIVKAAPKGNAAVELHEMIGLDNAKEVIENAVSFFKMQKLYAEKGIKADRPSMHMVFTGNPGTAKTTVARLFAQIMKDNGLLTKGDLYEVGRADIVGQFVGQTAPLVKKHFNMAKGSVLFIDEAYSLVDDRNGLYGDEAINTIVQEMENNRSDLVVIFAGYPDKMEEFLNKNPGLRSRIAFHVNFDDYSTDELIDIADLMIKKTGFKFTGEAHKKLGEVFDAARKKQDFGNGRYVRNLIELSSLKQASRLAKSDIDHLTDDEMRTITVADIAAPFLSQDDGKMAAIGF